MGLLMLNESAYKRDENIESAHFKKICVYCYFLIIGLPHYIIGSTRKGDMSILVPLFPQYLEKCLVHKRFSASAWVIDYKRWCRYIWLIQSKHLNRSRIRMTTLESGDDVIEKNYILITLLQKLLTRILGWVIHVTLSILLFSFHIALCVCNTEDLTSFSCYLMGLIWHP